MCVQHPNHYLKCAAFSILVSRISQFVNLLRQEVICKCFQQKNAHTF